jgi:hypothetical protein
MLERCFKKNPDIVSRKIANEFILVPIRKSVADLESIYTLNEVAAKIWELIDGTVTASQIRDSIVEEFKVDIQEAEKDLITFLQELEVIGGIKEV